MAKLRKPKKPVSRNARIANLKDKYWSYAVEVGYNRGGYGPLSKNWRTEHKKAARNWRHYKKLLANEGVNMRQNYKWAWGPGKGRRDDRVMP